MKTKALILSVPLIFGIEFLAAQIRHKVVSNKIVYSSGYEAELPDLPELGKTYIYIAQKDEYEVRLEISRANPTEISYRLTGSFSDGKSFGKKGKADISSSLFLGNSEEPLPEPGGEIIDCMMWNGVGRTSEDVQICLADAEYQNIQFSDNSIFVNADFQVEKEKTIHLNGFMYKTEK